MSRATDTAIAVALVAATVAVYAPVRRHEFLNYDDNVYVTENPEVRAGLTRESVVWAFTRPHSATWHPLTGVSHMLDVELFGMNAGAHLLVNVLLHAISTLLLFLALRDMTGARWPSAWVAALFALHPLHVESVAWVSERKDVLSGVFCMLTLWAYVRWVRGGSRRQYAVLVAVFALGLMAKPMLVTLPFVLLLLDVWPLARVRPGQTTRRPVMPLVVEKLPLLALAAVVSAVTYVAQTGAGAVSSLAAVPLASRIANVPVAYVSYLRKTVWPIDLAVFYPFVYVLAWRAGLAVVVLAAVSALVLHDRARRPYLLVGWAWYLGTLVPVIGLVHQGSQSMADRFTYLPLIGIFIMIAWGAADLLVARRVVAATAIATVIACALVTERQLAYWHDSITLFRHALAVTDDNYLAHTNLGAALDGAGQHDEAMRHYDEAVRINPDYPQAQLNVGVAMAARGNVDAAIAHYTEALRLDPRFPMAEYNWGLALAERGALDDAIAHYERALAWDPRYAKAHNNLGWALAAKGKLDDAIAHYRAAIHLAPDLTAAHNDLAVALEDAGHRDEALEQYREAVRLAPDEPQARYNLASALEGASRIDDAIAEYRVAVRLAPDLAEAHYGLGNALAARGGAREAAAHYREAMHLKPDVAEAARALAWLLATADDPAVRNSGEAIALAERARVQNGRDDPRILNTLAAAYAQGGRLADAVAVAERALVLARTAGDAALVADIENRLRRYREETASAPS